MTKFLFRALLAGLAFLVLLVALNRFDKRQVPAAFGEGDLPPSSLEAGNGAFWLLFLVEPRWKKSWRWCPLSGNAGFWSFRARRSTINEYSRLAFLRALELLNLTIADPRHRPRLKELTRLREALLDLILVDNAFRSSEKSWRSYFYGLAYAAAPIEVPLDLAPDIGQLFDP